MFQKQVDGLKKHCHSSLLQSEHKQQGSGPVRHRRDNYQILLAFDRVCATNFLFGGESAAVQLCRNMSR